MGKESEKKIIPGAGPLLPPPSLIGNKLYFFENIYVCVAFEVKKKQKSF
jgi:hypothetical protein